MTHRGNGSGPREKRARRRSGQRAQGEARASSDRGPEASREGFRNDDQTAHQAAFPVSQSPASGNTACAWATADPRGALTPSHQSRAARSVTP